MLKSTKSLITAKVRLITVTAEQAGQRIDNFLIRELRGVPRAKIYQILRKGEVRVNKGRIKPEYKLREADVVRIPPVRLLSKSEAATPNESLMKVLRDNILYEDQGLLIIDKPAGLAVHGGSGLSLGLIEALRAMRPQEKYLELVHRLDKGTSGLLLLAKKRSVLTYLHDEIRNNRIEKRYLALVYGRWPKRKRLVSAPLMKNQLSSGERFVRVDAAGKQSLTHFTVVESFRHASLIEAHLETGRTHQIRVHTQYAGFPILGDEKYQTDEAAEYAAAIELRRMFLHAHQLSFKLPGEQQPRSFTAPLPQTLARIIDQLRDET